MSRLPARIGFWAAAAESPISVIYIVGRAVLGLVATSFACPLLALRFYRAAQAAK